MFRSLRVVLIHQHSERVEPTFQDFFGEVVSIVIAKYAKDVRAGDGVRERAKSEFARKHKYAFFTWANKEVGACACLAAETCDTRCGRCRSLLSLPRRRG